MAARIGPAEWQGDLMGGNGSFSVGQSGALTGAYTSSRFEDGEGTNPEELIGAAHAACYSMAFSNVLAENGHTPESVKTTADVQIRFVDGAPTITTISLDVEGRVSGIDEAKFLELAEAAKGGCPVSRALAGVSEINLSAKLAS